MQKQKVTREQKLEQIKEKVENNSQEIDDIVDSIIKPYCNELDDYVQYILDELLQDKDNPPTDEELDDVCMYLSTLIYFAGGLCERLGVRDDIAKAVYKEMYHTERSRLNGGTIADKDSLAELASQEQAVISSAYTRSYKTMKAKVENAQEILQSCKKVMSRRMQERELTHIGGSGR